MTCVDGRRQGNVIADRVTAEKRQESEAESSSRARRRLQQDSPPEMWRGCGWVEVVREAVQIIVVVAEGVDRRQPMKRRAKAPTHAETQAKLSSRTGSRDRRDSELFVAWMM